jgi:hypothetical protein
MVYIVKNAIKPHGALIHFDPDPQRSKGQVKEKVRKTMACQHCGYQMILPENGELADVGDLCRHCWKFICPTCVKKGTCHPLEQHLADIEAGKLSLHRLP